MMLHGIGFIASKAALATMGVTVQDCGNIEAIKNSSTYKETGLTISNFYLFICQGSLSENTDRKFEFLSGEFPTSDFLATSATRPNLF
jgi:hypothetical protein